VSGRVTRVFHELAGIVLTPGDGWVQGKHDQQATLSPRANKSAKVRLRLCIEVVFPTSADTRSRPCTRRAATKHLAAAVVTKHGNLYMMLIPGQILKIATTTRWQRAGAYATLTFSSQNGAPAPKIYLTSKILHVSILQSIECRIRHD